MLPLAGLRVVDFTHVLAGPACSYYLGLMGAEIVKVESPTTGDAMRHRGGTDRDAQKRGMSTAYMTQGAGKKSLTLDLQTPDGAGAMKSLLEQADIFVENHLPQTMKSLGLEPNKVSAINPRLIHCSLTGYGRGGPLENTPAYDVNIQAISGLMSVTGFAETGPIRTGAPIVDYGVALSASFAITAALYDREQTKRGCFIDVSMLETAHLLMSSTITDYVSTGNAPKRRGNAANSRSPGAGNFPCKEGVLSLGVNEESQFKRLARVLDKDHWLTDSRYVNRAARMDNTDSLQSSLAEVLLTKTATEWEEVMQANGVPAAKLRSLPESLKMQHVTDRGFVHHFPDGSAVPTLPFRFNDDPPFTPSGSAPSLGQDSAEVLNTMNDSSGS